MQSRDLRIRILLCLSTLLISLLACTLPSILTSRSQTIHSLSPTSEPVSVWTIEQCNAMGHISVGLNNFEELVYNEDGDIDCNYDQEITNTGSDLIQVFYYKQWYYGNVEPPNDTEFGWQKIRSLQPGESWTLSNSFSYCADCAPPQYESFTFSLVAVYDVPGCSWVTNGDKIDLDILKIAEEELVFPPCTMIYPLSFSEAVPDISEGLGQ